MAEGEGATVESGDLSVTTNYGTAEEAQQQLALETPEPAQADGSESPDGRDPQTGQFTKAGQAAAQARKPRNDYQLRINEAIRAKREAEERARAAEQRAAALEARRSEAPVPRPEPRREPPPPRAADPDDPEPDPDDLRRYPDGQFDRKYLKEQSRWEARQEMRVVHGIQQQEQRTARERQALETRAAEVAQLIQQTDPALVDRIDARLADAVPLSLLNHVPPNRRPARVTMANWAAEQVFRSDKPMELAAHLSDPAEIQRLATLLLQHGESAALRDIARIEARLSAGPAAAAPRTPISHAKQPIKPLGSSPQQADPDEVTEDMTVEEHIRRMNAKDRREGRL